MKSLKIFLLLLLGISFSIMDAAELPFDSSCPVIVDNDDHRDVYTDEYMLALDYIGDIDLKALITTYAANQAEYDLFVRGRQEIIDLAGRSGMKDQPNAYAGTSDRLSRPESNRIEDTRPLNLKAGEVIVKHARQASPDQPLVIVAGGQLTAIADAYLQDPSIADKVVVSGIMGVNNRDYNPGLDPWAWTIVVSKFRVLSIPIGGSGNRGTVYMKPPEVPKDRIEKELPMDVPFFQWMYEKRHPSNGAPSGHDYDGQAAIPIMRPDYITEIQRWRPVGIKPNGDPELVEDPEGPIYKALDADQDIATEEFWRAMHELRFYLK
ncbi:MAG: hypothetical protein GF372_08415 [Candidatus Marinimicrobia bacterium]|nr:hypothetical protein [Candidatus Neomarinimicrobiota bacterium]